MNLLFICSRNRLRSPTAEAVFADYDNLAAESAGLERDADVVLSSESLLWADLIFVMETSHRRKLNRQFGPWLKGKRVICLDIPDQYAYMDPELIQRLKQKVLPILGLPQ